MNNPSLSDDSLDAMFSDFFKHQLKKPWPAAPVAPSVHSEPSTLAVARGSHTPETPRNQPVAANHDSSSKARYTLAASVALLIGTCWTLSNGFQTAERSATGNGSSGNPLNMNASTASDPAPLTELRKENATKGNNKNDGFVPPVIDLGP
ncbi:MAG: hypothetical protein C0467_12325 [Planctomycetaceae bacterium]|nr:hypothetical protein [Planctomycetaceae bacterium]